MTLKLSAAALLFSTLLTPAALAQATPPGGVAAPPTEAGPGLAPPNAAAGPVQFITRREPGVLRVSDLLEKDVFNAQNEDIGEVEDILVDRNGRVVGLVVEVGGFLGIGEREVAVPPSAIRIEPYDMTATTGTIPGEGLAPSTAAGAAQREENRLSRAIVPDRIVLTVPVDQLRSAPAYEDDDD